MSLKIFAAVLLLCASSGAVPAQEEAPIQVGEPVKGPQSEALQAETDALADRLSTSLMFRGETADKIIAAGLAPKLIDMRGKETYAEVRSAMMDWIRADIKRAAKLASSLEKGVGRGPGGPDVITRYAINERFLAKVRALNAAAGAAGLPAENLEAAARRLYEGSAEGDSSPVLDASNAPKGGSFFSGDYADYKLNRGGMEREAAGAGRLLEGLRGPAARGPAGAEAAYAAAMRAYAAFLVASSAVKNRKVISAGESEGLERGRAALRRALAALMLRTLAAETAALASGREASPLSGEAAALRRKAEELAAAAEAPGMELASLGALVAGAEREYSALYIKVSVHASASELARRAGSLGYSCLYDYLLYQALGRLHPGAAGPAARARAASAAAAAALAADRAASGDAAGALEAVDLEVLGADTTAVARYSLFNRAVQFFSWELLLRPVAVEVAVKDGRASLRPSVTFFSLLSERR